ncbi:MAG: hypothetical protein AB7K24_22295 [Gemmataceae bacterium]
MKIRTFKPGDESTQAALFNEAAAHLPKYKAASADDIKRRTQDQDYDPSTHLFAEEGGQVVGYCSFLTNGRIGYPWCKKGQEAAAAPLFQAALAGMKQRGLTTAFAAYRADWKEILTFFEQQGFQKVRDVVNYLLDLLDMPTRSTGPIGLQPLTLADLPALVQMAPKALRTHDLAALEKHYFHNPYFQPDSTFVLRARDGTPAGIGILIQNSDYAEPRSVDANMPCFRLGSFGSEGLPAKRMDGLFSLLTSDKKESTAQALALLEHAAQKQEDRDESTLVAQCYSDAGHLASFYNRYFRKQGSFPVYEKKLS